MSEDYTLEEIASNNKFYATLVVPYNIGCFDISVPRSFSLFPLYFDPSLFVCFFNNHIHYNIFQYGKEGAFGTAEKSP